jgi:hypothetical protein
MLPANTPFDITGTVRLDSAAAVASATSRLLAERFPAAELDASFLRHAFADVETIYWGRHPGYLGCDTPYHDLRHALDTALLVARMIDGYQAALGQTPAALNGREAELAVFLALCHDIGFLRKRAEEHICGATLVRQHETRSVDFARHYLADSPLADFAESAELIHVTNFAHATTIVLHGHPTQQAAIAKMIGSADLISQISDRCYLERARDFLYREFWLAGADRIRDSDGHETLLYADGDDLLTKTPGFYDHVVKHRLEKNFDGIYLLLKNHFAGVNPYTESMTANLDYLRQLIAEGRLSDGLRRHPVPLIPETPEVPRTVAP